MAKKLSEIKQELDLQLGKRILLRANGGRKKMFERTGILAETYPSVFIVRLEKDGDTYERVSYSYADVLTETVKLIFEEEKSENLA